MTTATATLTEFLLARIAEDEAEIGVLFGRDEKAGPNGIGWAEVGAISDVLMCGHVRALAECEAKRRILAMHYDVERQWDWACDGDVEEGRAFAQWPCETVRILAAVYADHPDYRDEWRP